MVGPGGLKECQQSRAWLGLVESQTAGREDLSHCHTVTLVSLLTLHTTNMGKFSLTNLIMCVSKYQKLNSEDYIRLGLCLPDCQDCATGPGHFVKNDKMVSHPQSVSQSVIQSVRSKFLK